MNHLLELSTEVEPAKTFTVDGEEYKLLGMEHLSPGEEAKATAAFTRFAQLMQRLDRSTNDRDAERVAEALRGRRIELITMLTTMDRETADKLPLSAQVKLFSAVQEESGQAEDTDAGFGLPS